MSATAALAPRGRASVWRRDDAAAMARRPLRDPAARARATALVVAVVVLWPLLWLAEFKPWQLFGAATCR